jgi:alpha-methylacyl-CoA racemase
MTRPLDVLHGTRVLSLALNLPGPAALMRCRRMGAACVKLEPPSGDPMAQYNPVAYAQLHEGVRVIEADLKSDDGQKLLHRALAETDVLLTSFRPSALEQLGLAWAQLHAAYPTVSQVAIVGAPGAGAEHPGHDLTYLADQGLVTGLELPATLYADMSGSLMASEAVLQAALLRQERHAGTGTVHTGVYIEVALSEAAQYVALPREWGLTQPNGPVGGAHAGYGIYRCKDGRVAVAALEPHFAAALCAAAGAPAPGARTMFMPVTHEAVRSFFAGQTREQLDRLARERDIPLYPLP